MGKWGRTTIMSNRPVYVVDEQKRITLGHLVIPGDRYDVTADEDTLILVPREEGRVRVDARRRLPLGRMTLAGAMYRADIYADGRVVLQHLLLLDPSLMDPDLIAAVQDYRVDL